jgi:eukaryotic-like serine/threonine-protein kinase
MTAERWSEVKPVLARLMEADEQDRPALLDELCGSDAELRRSVESLLSLEAQADDLLNSALAPGAALRTESPAPETIGPYRVVSEIGRGGMGVVYLAERSDGEYQKRVAIKLITTGMRHAGLERRFRRERQILAQLEHPGIARLLDGAATVDGQPYLVMEYVEGMPLLAYCEAAQLGVEARLELLVSICDAVSYAHQRLVVHRDLKPGNILITPDGQSKLLDFGLARVLESGTDLTDTGVQAMTPAYASPEQIRGEPDTVASDVYSLGVILYELLASRRPYRNAKSLAQLARAIAEEMPVPLPEAVPAALRKRVRGDLETIAAKALEKDARRRYATVGELAEDVRRHLEGRPVKARRATLRYRFGKALRRHRIAIPAAALALSLIVGFAGAAWWEARQAQRRFDQVRGLAHSVLFELHDAIERLPGSTAARELLVRRALEYLENLSKESGRNAAVAHEVALGYERVGIVQGYLGDSNLGKVTAALESFRKADSMLAGLAVRDSGRGLLKDRLRVANELAVTFASSGRIAEARTVLSRNVAAYEQALGREPAESEWLVGLAAAEGNLADTFTDEQRYREAIPWRERAKAHAQEAASRAGAALERWRALAIAEKRLGALYGVEKRYEECRREYEAARAIDERRLAASPHEPRTMLDLSYDYSDLGWVQGRLGHWSDAEVAYRRTLALREDVAARDPQDQRAAVSLAGAADKLGFALHRLGDLKGSVRELARSVALYQRLVDGGGNDWSTVHNLAEAHVDLGETLADAGERARAASEIREARRLYIGLRDRGILPAAYLKEVDELERQALALSGGVDGRSVPSVR